MYIYYIIDLVHLDLRPANVFISINRAKMEVNQIIDLKREFTLATKSIISKELLNKKYLLKVGDFGHCCLVDQDGYLKPQVSCNNQIREGEEMYCPRELIQENDISHIRYDLRKCDMFSLGISIYELCNGIKLGSSDVTSKQEWHNIRDGKLDKYFIDNYSQTLVNVIQEVSYIKLFY